MGGGAVLLGSSEERTPPCRQTYQSFSRGRAPGLASLVSPRLMVSLAVLTLVAICQLQKYLIHLIVSLYVVALAEESLVASRELHHSSSEVGCRPFSSQPLAGGLQNESNPQRPWRGLVVGGYAFALLEGTIMMSMFHGSHQAIQQHAFLGGIALGSRSLPSGARQTYIRAIDSPPFPGPIHVGSLCITYFGDVYA